MYYIVFVCSILHPSMGVVANEVFQLNQIVTNSTSKRLHLHMLELSYIAAEHLSTKTHSESQSL